VSRGEQAVAGERAARTQHRGVAAATRRPGRQVGDRAYAFGSGVWSRMRPGRRPPPCRLAGEAGTAARVSKATTPPSATGAPGQSAPSPIVADTRLMRTRPVQAAARFVAVLRRPRSGLASLCCGSHGSRTRQAARAGRRSGPRPRQRHPAPSRPGSRRGCAARSGPGAGRRDASLTLHMPVPRW